MSHQDVPSHFENVSPLLAGGAPGVEQLHSRQMLGYAKQRAAEPPCMAKSRGTAVLLLPSTSALSLAAPPCCLCPWFPSPLFLFPPLPGPGGLLCSLDRTEVFPSPSTLSPRVTFLPFSDQVFVLVWMPHGRLIPRLLRSHRGCCERRDGHGPRGGADVLAPLSQLLHLWDAGFSERGGGRPSGRAAVGVPAGEGAGSGGLSDELTAGRGLYLSLPASAARPPCGCCP